MSTEKRLMDAASVANLRDLGVLIAYTKDDVIGQAETLGLEPPQTDEEWRQVEKGLEHAVSEYIWDIIDDVLRGLRDV